MITSWVEACCVSLVFLIDFSGTQPVSHYNDFIELTTPCTQNPSLSLQPDALPTLSSSFPQKPSRISCRKTVLCILGQHAALPALLTQHRCSVEPRSPSSLPWWPSKAKFVKRLVSSLTVPWLPKDCAFLLYHSCYASTMNKDFFLICPVEKSGQEPKGNARGT